MCPTIRNDNIMISFRPTRTCHAGYCMTNRFLFWPLQLLACRCSQASPMSCQKMVKHADDVICPFAGVYSLVDEVVDL